MTSVGTATARTDRVDQRPEVLDLPTDVVRVRVAASPAVVADHG
jgi:hypothetical protein